ncbi:hypothetical protein J6590_046365 [Homalodisca vitripennis]|nr:hypothetical protein J6590_046365 [Homalodisca vitripennis]
MFTAEGRIHQITQYWIVTLGDVMLDNTMNKMLECSGEWETLKEMAWEIIRRKKEEGRLELA